MRNRVRVAILSSSLFCWAWLNQHLQPSICWFSPAKRTPELGVLELLDQLVLCELKKLLGRFSTFEGIRTDCIPQKQVVSYNCTSASSLEVAIASPKSKFYRRIVPLLHCWKWHWWCIFLHSALSIKIIEEPLKSLSLRHNSTI